MVTSVRSIDCHKGWDNSSDVRVLREPGRQDLNLPTTDSTLSGDRRMPGPTGRHGGEQPEGSLL